MENITCILCPNGCSLSIEKIGQEWDIKGNKCPKGKEFAISEITDPRRIVCSTIKTTFKKVPRLPVKTNGEVPLKDVFNVMTEINSKSLGKPVQVGDVVIENVSNTGINVIATSNLYYLLGDEKNE
jgi:CxxC motif-containing protein